MDHSTPQPVPCVRWPTHLDSAAFSCACIWSAAACRASICSCSSSTYSPLLSCSACVRGWACRRQRGDQRMSPTTATCAIKANVHQGQDLLSRAAYGYLLLHRGCTTSCDAHARFDAATLRWLVRKAVRLIGPSCATLIQTLRDFAAITCTSRSQAGGVHLFPLLLGVQLTTQPGECVRSHS